MVDKKKLEDLYRKYNSREHIHPDPLELVYNYTKARDMEIAGLIASSLAYGRVGQILKHVSYVLGNLGKSPYSHLMAACKSDLEHLFDGFKYRFTDSSQLVFFLLCTREALIKYGSLNECFLQGYNHKHKDILPALLAFIKNLTCRPSNFCNSLLPAAGGKSALKRFNLYLRWMVRSDNVDPGCWEGIPPSKLIIPLDTHMHKTALKLGLTSRKQADMGTALEITEAFRKIEPEDPVKYDFCLTRLGINKLGYIF